MCRLAIRSLLLAAVFAVACTGSDGAGTADPTGTSPPTTSSPSVISNSVLGPVPDEARITTGGGEPRSAGYWEIWSRCGEHSQAAVAEANGGRAAGWILLDDLIADPGLSVGTFDIVDCEAALVVLRAGRESDADPVLRLASQVLLAQANLSAGAESCPAVEGVVRAGQILLSDIGFERGATRRDLVEREAKLASDLGDVLASHSSGELCR